MSDADDVGHRAVLAMPAIEIAKAFLVEVIGPFLDPRELFRESGQPGRILVDAAQERHRLGRQPGRLDDRGPHLLHAGVKARLFEEGDRLHRLVHLVDGIVHRLDQVA